MLHARLSKKNEEATEEIRLLKRNQSVAENRELDLAAEELSELIDRMNEYESEVCTCAGTRVCSCPIQSSIKFEWWRAIGMPALADRL